MAKYKVLHVAAEAAPFAKVGGLADVLGSLPKAENQLNSEFLASVVIPCYDVIDRRRHRLVEIARASVLFEEREYSVRLFKTHHFNVDFYFIQNKEFLGGGKIYLTRRDELLKQLKRYEFFSGAVLQLIAQGKLTADILHCHDWHSAPLLPLTTIPSVFTIHNLANQGPIEKAPNFMKLGIENADIITTVSPSYRDEVLTPEFGEGLHEVLRKREKDFYGILNGIDYDVFNPETDPSVPFHYNWRNLEEKKKNKKILQKIFDLETDEKKMVIGVVSRLVWQKAIDTAVPLFQKCTNVQWVILGTGDREIEEALKLGARGLKNVRIDITFSLDLASKIYAGSDLFFMPSRFEPCGLGQMIAMRYGTLPFVKAVGGLKDTVEDLVDGFVFERGVEMMPKLRLAKRIFSQEPARWRKMQERAMRKDFSWKKSAKKYIGLYRKLASQFKI